MPDLKILGLVDCQMLHGGAYLTYIVSTCCSSVYCAFSIKSDNISIWLVVQYYGIVINPLVTSIGFTIYYLKMQGEGKIVIVVIKKSYETILQERVLLESHEAREVAYACRYQC